MIKISKDLSDEINKYSETEYPNECCGLLLGMVAVDKSKSVEELLPISNAREEKDKHNRFLITPDELMHAEMYARKKKIDIVGFYHSHPDHPSAPSEFDLEHAWPFYSYIIASVAKGKAENMTSWELENDRSKFNPEIIIKGE
jgi:proteasome lid subunit RPN8/RPN11